jgi:NAD(P)-dependent dehydrogenase (short-subunit alcohol dehydrogenase family)
MENKKYVIIGGSSGIGLSIVNQLTSEGHQVINFSRNEGNWENKNLVDHIKLDIISDELPDSDQIDSANGLVYCPGTINLKPFQQLSESDFKNDFEINVLGAVRALKHFYKALRKGKPSSIILFSTVAVNPGMAFHASISAAKGAIEGLARSLAAEFAPNIRVNAIAPSLTDTDLASKILSSEDRREASNKRHPLGRVGRPEDIASLAVYLLGDQADWITGQVIGVDGGMAGTR